MKRELTIRKLIAAFLMLLFLFGTTPKQFLHSLVADHKDTYSFKVSGTDGEPVNQISKTLLNCHCESLVVESPFVDGDSQIQILSFTFYPPLLTPYCNNYCLPHHSYFKLRGPPALITAAI